jgi:hypothetical protein
MLLSSAHSTRSYAAEFRSLFPRSEQRVSPNRLSDHRMEWSRFLQTEQFTRSKADLSALCSIFSPSNI